MADMMINLLHDITEIVTRAGLPDQTIRAALKRLSDTLGGAALLALVTPTGPHVQCVMGQVAGEQAHESCRRLDPFLKKVTEKGLPIINEKEAPYFWAVPIHWNGEIVGVLGVQLAASAPYETSLPALLDIIAMMLAHSAETTRHAFPSGEHLSGSVRLPGFIGTSEAMMRIYEQIAQVAPSPTTVLLRGESGTGKELAARAIHRGSSRANGPFVSLNCAALPENLIESELFGHERGAFTGAAATRKGRFELADGGTLFLDEVGELSLLTQAKLLRVIQERRFERLGAMESRQVDVRIIAATNQPLEDMVNAGTFRRDLYYRLNVFPIKMPALRDRRSDILPLASHFLRTFAADSGRGGMSLSLPVMELLQHWNWPGNIRELENVIERAVLIVGDEGVVMPHHLPAEIRGCEPSFGGQAQSGMPGSMERRPLQTQLDELEYSRIIEELKRYRGHIGHAAAALGLTERVMALRMKKYQISYKTFRSMAD